MLISVNSGFYSGRPNRAPRYDMIHEAIDYFADHGFEAVDVNFSAVIYDESTKKVHEPVLDGDNWKENMDRLVEKCKARNLKIVTSHLPFFSYTKTPEPEYSRLQSWTYKALEAADYIGAEWTVVHMAKTANETIPYVRDLCAYARTKTPNGKIGLAVENTPRSTVDELIKVVDALEKEGYPVGVCFDIGHCNYAGLDVPETIKKLGKRIKMLHLHDNYGDRDAHQTPYGGNIPWEPAMKALAEIGYDGEFNYEVTVSHLPEAVRGEYADFCVKIAKYLIAVFEAEKAKL